MNHRGACSCDNDSGDGAGVLTAIPHSFYAHELRFDIYFTPRYRKIENRIWIFFSIEFYITLRIYRGEVAMAINGLTY